VTICYNNRDGVKKTLDSFLQQTFQDYEVIVVDGQSTDGTLELLEEYKTLFEEQQIPFSYLSETDSGRYDAMNKGIARAKGEWICFMNSGDVLADADVLEEIFDRRLPHDDNYRNVDILYGDNQRSYQGILEYHKAGQNLDYIKKGLPFSHQSVFTRTELFTERPYDKRFQLSGDYEWFLNAYQENRRFCYIPVCVSIFDMDGVSSRKQYENYKEVLTIRKIHKVEDPWPLRMAKLLAWKLIEVTKMDNRKVIQINDKKEKE
jgi:glycosyltransferase involved in cell wall biosynthesis